MKAARRMIFAIIIHALMIWEAGAQTALVHSPFFEDGEEELYLLQSAESGIMEVLFDKGWIVFSDNSHCDDAALMALATRTGSDYIISWNCFEKGLEGRLFTIRKGFEPESVWFRVEEPGERGTGKDVLFETLGRQLCQGLVAVCGI